MIINTYEIMTEASSEEISYLLKERGFEAKGKVDLRRVSIKRSLKAGRLVESDKTLFGGYYIHSTSNIHLNVDSPPAEHNLKDYTDTFADKKSFIKSPKSIITVNPQHTLDFPSQGKPVKSLEEVVAFVETEIDMITKGLISNKYPAHAYKVTANVANQTDYEREDLNN